MSKRIFSDEELKALRNNPNVATCTNRYINFSKAFKLLAVKAYQGGQSAKTIFQQAGFDLNVVGKQTPKFRLMSWKKIYKNKGEAGLKIESRGRGGGRKVKDKSSSDVEYLQAKIAYLEAENNFLRTLKTKNKI